MSQSLDKFVPRLPELLCGFHGLELIASIFGVAWTFWPRDRDLTGFEGAVLAFLAILFLGASGLDFWLFSKHRPKKLTTQSRINSYMYDWISKMGRVVVFTRDHSWIQEDRMRNLLLEKARRNELTICLPAETDLTKQLRSEGAEIVAYSKLDYSPGSRFTIINDGRAADSRVAIGKQIRGVQVVEEFESGDPVLAVTQDLVEVLRRVSR